MNTATTKNIQEDDLSDGDKMPTNNVQEDESGGFDDESGGFDVEFVDKTKTDVITCNICNLILREPVQASPCGHRFCGSCIEKFHKRK